MTIISSSIMPSARLESQPHTLKIQLSLNKQNSRLKISKKQSGISAFRYKPGGELGALKELSWALTPGAGATQGREEERPCSGVWSCVKEANKCLRKDFTCISIALPGSASPLCSAALNQLGRRSLHEGRKMLLFVCTHYLCVQISMQSSRGWRMITKNCCQVARKLVKWTKNKQTNKQKETKSEEEH